MKVEKVTLEGKGVRLEPLSASKHLRGLAEAIGDGSLWQLPMTLVPHPDDLDDFFADAELAFRQGRELAFTIVDTHNSQVVGSTRFRCIEARHRRVEIGFTFLAQSRQRSFLNTEAKWLMLNHAFDVWGVHRVELLTDVRNEKSRRAIERIGAIQEGILQSHMVMRDGHIRDSVLFSIVSSQWPETRAILETKRAR